MVSLTGESAVGYIRVSDEELQGDNFSLPNQRHEIRRHAEERGYALVKVFQDMDTGSELDRESLEELLDYIELHKVKVVIVYKFDRLGRGTIQTISKWLVAERGARVESATEANEDTPEARAMRGVMEVFSGYERETIIRRSKDGRKSRARMGNVMLTYAPYGYRIVRPDEKHTYLEIEPAEEAIVILVYRWYVYGDENGTLLSVAGIARKLTAMGVPTRGDGVQALRKQSGKGTWVASVISRMLKKRLYLGIWKYNQTTVVGKKKLGMSAHTGKKYRQHILARTDPKEHISVDVPPIIDEITWEAAQRRIEKNLPRNGGAGRPGKHPYLLRGLIRCGVCHYSMFGNFFHSKSTIWHEYRCAGKRHHKGCDLPGFNGQRLEAKIWAWVIELGKHPERVDEVLSGKKSTGDSRHKQELSAIQAIEQMIAKKQRSRDSIKELHQAGGISTAEAVTDLKKIDSEIAEHEAQRDKIAARLRGATYSEQQVAVIRATMDLLRHMGDPELSAEITLTEKRRILDLLETRVICTHEAGRRYAVFSCIVDSHKAFIPGRGEADED